MIYWSYLMKLYYLLMVGFALTLAFPALAVFDRNLQVGSVGGDVALLQQVLNSDPVTQITNFGPGSPGQETIIFGQLTKKAVIKLQEKYRSEVLTPAGLSAGTGFVGPTTRVLLEKLYKTTGPLTISIVPYATPLEVPPPPPPIEMLNRPTSQSGNQALVVVSNKVEPLADDLIKALKQAGITEKEYRERNAPQSPYLKINSISPIVGGVNTEVTIIGSGFSTTSGQDIYVGPDVVKKVKSRDGKTLKVRIPNPYPSSSHGESISFNSTQYPFPTPMGIWVRDVSGISNPVVFTLEL